MKNKRKNRKSTYRRGLWAERLAAFYLQLKFYSIVERRFKTKLGEIDLIARRKSLVVIVEVKARSTLAKAHDAIDRQSQKRIVAATDLWLLRQHDCGKVNVRFDVIIIRPWCWPCHIKAFFTP